MHTVTSLLVLFLSATAIASSEPDARLSIVRELGAGGGLGTETTELVCPDKKQSCSVKKFRHNTIVESAMLSRERSLEIISSLMKEMQQVRAISTSKNVEKNLSWALKYHSDSMHGELSAQSPKKALLSLMKAEASIWVSSK